MVFDVIFCLIMLSLGITCAFSEAHYNADLSVFIKRGAYGVASVRIFTKCIKNF